MAQRSRKQGGFAPQDAGGWNNQGASYHRPQALGRQRRRRTATACCLAAPFNLTNNIPDLMVCNSEAEEVNKEKVSVSTCRSSISKMLFTRWRFASRTVVSWQFVPTNGTAGMMSGQCCRGAPGTGVFSAERVADANLCGRPFNRHTARLAHRGSVCCFGAFSVSLSTGARRIVAPLCLELVPK